MENLESGVGAIADGASSDGHKQAFALILCGVLEAAAALWLLVYKQPGGVFLHHGKAAFCSYYVVLSAVLLFGFTEASVGFWVKKHVNDRQAVRAGAVVLWLSLVPLVLVAGLGGAAFAVPK